jgi:hypothetical protein
MDLPSVLTDNLDSFLGISDRGFSMLRNENYPSPGWESQRKFILANEIGTID